MRVSKIQSQGLLIPATASANLAGTAGRKRYLAQFGPRKRVLVAMRASVTCRQSRGAGLPSSIDPEGRARKEQVL